MAAPWFGSVVPFVLKDTEGLLPEPPPPHLGSGAYAKAYDEVKALGALVNSSRTPEQTDLALFYSDNYPDYTSGANSVTGAFMRTVALFFDDDAPFPFDVTSVIPAVIQKTRTYNSFSAVMDDVVEARILLGIHFRFADVVARRHGKQAADRAFSHALQPLD